MEVSIYSKIYNMCPKASHSHRKDTIEETEKKVKLGFTKEMCVKCYPEKNPFPYTCEKYLREHPFHLSRESKITLIITLKKIKPDSQLWLPPELHRYIIAYFKKPFYPLSVFNKITKRHFETCSTCGENLVKFVENCSCSNHVVIRK